jgi:hypothetical protein
MLNLLSGEYTSPLGTGALHQGSREMLFLLGDPVKQEAFNDIK